MERKSSTKCKANTKRRAVRRRGGVEFQTYFYRKYPQYTYVYSKIKSFKGDYVYWHDLTDGFLDDLADWFKEEVSSGSARTYFAIIKSLIDKGKAAGYDIPCTNHHEILTAKPNKVVKTFLTLDELEKIEEYLPERDVEVYVRKNVLLGAYLGCRKSDFCQIKRENIIDGTLVYISQKTKIQTAVPVKPIVYDLLEQEGKPCSLVEFNETFRDICRKCGINTHVKVMRGGEIVEGPKWQFVSSHTARISFCSNLHLAGADILTISRLVGHRDTQTTERYIACSRELPDNVLQFFQ